MKVFDQVTESLVVEDNQAQVIYESGDVLYVCKAVIGTALSAPCWQIKKINAASGVVIEWADGNATYDNKATDLETVSHLDYS